MGQTWAAFDFDGTLTRRDSLLPFLRGLLGARRMAVVLALEAPWLLGFAARVLDRERVKVRLLRRALGGMPRATLEQAARDFADRGVPALLRPALLRQLRLHQARGHRCVLVTASPTLYTRPWALGAGFAAVLGSEMAYDDADRATGELAGGNCWGPEKARRLRELLPPGATLWAYGDSRGDREMLAMADHAWRVGAGNGHGRHLPPPGE